MSENEHIPNEESKSVSSTAITPEERHELIAVAAYYRAQIRSFAPGAELQDWLEAEVEVDSLLESSTANR